MTTTIVLGRTDDGYLVSGGATFNDARFGTADSVGVGNLSYWGQRTFGSGYEVREAALGFAFPAVDATEMVCSAVVQLQHSGQNSPARVRDMRLKPRDWVPSGLTVADYMTSGQLQAADTWSTIVGGQVISTRITYMGGDRMLAHLEAGNASMTFLAVAKTTEDGGPVPVGDELATFWSGNSSGTTNDPRLVYTTVPRHKLVPVLGASVTLSDGTHASLEVGSGVITLKHTTDVTSASQNLPADFALDTPGAQGFALTVDDQDAVYVVGRSATVANAVAVRAYTKNPSGAGWSGAGPVRTAGMPGFPSALNNFAAAWHPTAGGTLVVVASHTAGDAVSGSSGNDIGYALLASASLKTGAGTAVRAIGSALGLFTPARSPESTVFNTHANETGTGLDVLADPVRSDWGYVFSFNKGTLVGQNNAHWVGRYVLNATGTGFVHTSTQNEEGWGVKDANGKLRLVSIGSGQVAAVSADDETGYGLSLNIWQASGSVAGFVQLGQILMDQQGVTGFPSPADFSMASTWDVVYSSLENKLWVYYIKAGTDGEIQRTSVDLNTYQATGVVQAVNNYTATHKVVSLRVPRAPWATTHTYLDVALKAQVGGAFTLATIKSGFNVAPLAPTLVPHGNYDATTASLFSWSFNDTPGDTQSAYQLQVVDEADGSVDIDTGKTASATASRTVAASTLANPKSYRWRVRTWDALDLDGPWSDYGTFSTGAGGTVTVTDPAVDNAGNIQTDDYVVRWSVSGTVQASYRVILVRTDTGATISDSGWIAGTDVALQVGGMVTDVQHRVDVQVRNAGLVASAIGSRLITPSYAVPEIPIITVVPFPEDGYVQITVDNPTPGAPAVGAQAYDFETDVAALNGSGSITITQSTAQAHKGTGSAKHVTAVSPGAASRIRGVEALLFSVVPGRRYTARFWCYSPVGYAGHTNVIDWKPADPTMATISTNPGPATNVPAGVWTLVTCTALAPAGAVRAVYGPGFAPSPAIGYEFYVDELEFTEASDRPDVARNLVLRRPVGSTDVWDLVGECGPDGSVRDYTCPAWVPVQYMVRGES